MGVDKANPKPEFPVPPEPTTGSLIVPRPSPEGAISKALCPDCAFPCGQALGRGLRAPAQSITVLSSPEGLPLRLGGRLPERICPVGPLANRRDGCGFGVRPGQHCHSPLIVPMRYARCRVAVYGALPSTLTTEWQCESHCRSLPGVLVALPLASERSDAARSTPSGSVRRAAQHAHHRVAV